MQVSEMSDRKSFDDEYDVAWFDADDNIHMESLTVVVVAAAFAKDEREFDALVGFYAGSQTLMTRIIWDRYCDIGHEISRGAYQRQTRAMFRTLRPFAGDILDAIRRRHEARAEDSRLDSKFKSKVRNSGSE